MRQQRPYSVSRNTPVSIAAVWLGVISAAVALSVPLWGSPSFMRWAVEVICYLVLAQMWNLLAGYGGLLSVGQQAFVGIGGYTLFIFAQHLGLHPFLAVPLGGLAAAVIATMTAPVVFRLRDGYFAIGTWVVAELIRIGVSNLSVLGGGSGQSLTVMSQISRSTRETGTYLIAAVILIAASVAINLLLRSRFGLGLTALRDSENAAESQGVDVKTLKLCVYVFSAFGTGLVGALYYMSVLRISPGSAFDLNWIVGAIFIVVIGGIGTLEGPLVGAGIFFALRWLLADWGSWYWLVMGAVAVGVIVYFPKGIWGFVQARFDLQLLPLQRRLILSLPERDRRGPATEALETK